MVVNPGSPGAWEIQLRPGINSLGRGAANDFQIPHGSVSGSHCEISVSDGRVLLRDLGSTNGSFVNRTQVQEAGLEHGQPVRLGDIEMVFYEDGKPDALPAATTVRESPSEPVVPRSGTRVGLAHMTATLPSAVPGPAVVPRTVGAQCCRFHPKMPAKFGCDPCEQFFCEACVATRNVSGVPHKFCRQCGAECVQVLAQFAPEVEKGFWARFPGAFLYPLRGVGVIIVVVGIVLVALLKLGEAAIEYRTIRMIIFGVIMQIFVGGYLFTFLQAIIHSTEAGDRELPDLPGISNFLDDVIIPFGRLLTLSLVCFGPAVGIGIWLAVTHQLGLIAAFIVAVVLGYLYFPMAFLAVATLDSLGAANPLLVVPSILRAPAEYFVALGVLASVFATQFFGAILLNFLFPEGWIIHAMGGLVAMLAMMVFLSFLSLYLLIVAVHLLGLIFVTKKERLGWLAKA